MRKIIYLLLATVLSAIVQPAIAQQLALVNATIYTAPGATAITNGTILINKGKITAVGSSRQIVVPKSSTRIDCKGKTITAAFWNSHVHFIEPHWQDAGTLPAATLSRQITAMLTQYGFAYVWDLASLDFKNLSALRSRINRGEIKGPRIFAVGVPFAPPDGSPFYIAPLTLPEISRADSAVAYVQRQMAQGADGIKLWTASPAHNHVIDMPSQIALAAVTATHKAGKQVFAHPTNNDGVAIALQSGVDNLAHAAPDDGQPWRATMIDSMLKQKMALIPTLKLFAWELERAHIPTEHHALLVTAQKQLKQYAAAGGTILFGTDAGYMTDYNPSEEYVLMQESGLSFRQVLASLTTAPAQRFGLGAQTGRVAAGMNADLVVLDADPSKDIRALSKVVYTLRGGTLIFNKTQKGF